MKRLIDAQDAFNVLSDYYHHNSSAQHLALEEALNKVPTVDAEPVKRGMWTFIRLTDKDWGHKAKECSSCGSTFFDTRQWNYCPNCGADMRGEE